MKIVINRCFGGFGLSMAAIKRYLALDGKTAYFYKRTKFQYRDGVDEYVKTDEPRDSFWTHVYTRDLGESFQEPPEGNEGYFTAWDISRTDLKLVQVVEELGDAASDQCSKLRIVEIPDGVEWEIDEYDGMETVNEKHRSWS